MKYITILILSISSIFTTVNAQLFVDTDLAVNGGGILKVQNNSLQTGANGNLENAGIVAVDYDYVNNGNSTGFSTTTGAYNIGGNWVNNNTFNADNSTVHLFNADKLITGTSPTDFYNLKLSGGKLMTIDASAVWLDLGIEHLLTDENVMLINNTDPTSLIYTTGYISSRGDGHLKRKTQSTSTYTFPLGSDIGDFRLRPIHFTPTDNQQNTFGARLANNEATSDNYYLDEKSPLVSDLNPLYYHHLYHSEGASTADVTFFYDANEDEVTETIGRWNNKWTIVDNVVNGNTSGNYSSLVLSNFNDFSDRPFILASKGEFIYIPNAITPNGDGHNETLELVFDNDKLRTFEFYIFDRWGKLIFESHHSTFSWDGTSKGQKVPTGAYVWKMQYQLEGGSDIVEKLGTITVL